MANVVSDTLAVLSKAREERGRKVLVAYSGGKDSLAVMDLCVRSFDEVSAFFMYLVPGLEVIERQLEECKSRWGVEVKQYPHPALAIALREGVYCPSWYTNDALPEWKIRDVYNLASAEAGCKLIATGAKSADGIARKRYFANTKNWDDMLYPIKGWNKLDVLGYLRARGIPLPPSNGAISTGIGMGTKALLWLYDTYPNDFAKLCETFPFAEAVVYRRNWYG